MNNMRKASNTEYHILLGLIIYMPFHYYICELFLKSTLLDNLVRDIFILFIFILSIAKYGLKLKTNGMVTAFNATILALFALVSAMINGYPGTFNILRTYLIPMLMYFICCQIKLSEIQLRTIHKTIAVELAIIAMYGFIQAFFLGDDFAIKLGYPSKNGYLSSSSYYIGGFFGFQRSVGTFVSPNIFGVILGVAICLLLTDCVQTTKLKRYLLIGLTVVGLLATFSRSAIFGVLLAIIFLNATKLRITRLNPRKILYGIIVAVGIIVIVLLVDKYFLDKLFTDMMYSSFSSIITQKDLSVVKHINDLSESLHQVILHPFGFGFGSNGPMVEGILDNCHLVESSIYLMMYEVGIIFGILFFVPFVFVIVKTYKNRRYKYYAPAAICIMELVTFVLLPNVQTYEVLFYAFLFMGLYDNQSIRVMYMARIPTLDCAQRSVR